ncbi:hypothetical protein M2456_001964 [Ohessyouella blattaphilus]|uniref:lysozyme family protein n=1 Tax=Ohessyouella blattaphilus TaxID=2949333 RepID=UPI003E19E9E0
MVNKGVKALEKGANATGRMKDAYVKTKDKANQGLYAEENSPNEYAGNSLPYGVDRVSRKVLREFDKQGRNGVKATRQNIKKTKVKIDESKKRKTNNQPKNNTPVKGYSTAKTGTPTTYNATQSAKQPVSTGVQALKGKKIKDAQRSLKSTAKGTIKNTHKSARMATKSAKMSVKTTGQAAKAAQRAAKQTAKNTQRAAQLAKATIKTVIHATKVIAKMTISSVKAIIAATKALVSALMAGGWIVVLLLLIVVLFGAFFAITGGNNEASYTPVSAEVEAYTPLISKYAKQHGIGEYVELIKAVMMQESGGKGSDPMQASECGFNTRYPRKPNGITDPEYSVDVGVQNLASCLQSAGVENPIDMENIKLGLQGYNFGNGYISWTKSNHGGYSYANAMEFSEMMAKKNGWSSYGDTQYVTHVLRYYPFGKLPSGIGNGAIIEVAMSQLGNKGGQPYWSWYGFGSRVEWCACFVSWCAEQCGYIEAEIIPRFSYCPTGADWFKSRGQWHDRSYEPVAGDIIFFDWEGDGVSDHVGYVEKVENGRVYTIEGNSGDACQQMSYAVGSSLVYGYGIIAY